MVPGDTVIVSVVTAEYWVEVGGGGGGGGDPWQEKLDLATEATTTFKCPQVTCQIGQRQR